MKTKTYDFQSFVSGGQLVPIRSGRNKKAETAITCGMLGAIAGSVTVIFEHDKAFAANATPTMTGATPDISTAFDPVIHMLQDMSLPVCSIVLAWACLQAMIGHPAQAVDKAKWAVIGYLAMQYVPNLLKSIVVGG